MPDFNPTLNVRHFLCTAAHGPPFASGAVGALSATRISNRDHIASALIVDLRRQFPYAIRRIGSAVSSTEARSFGEENVNSKPQAEEHEKARAGGGGRRSIRPAVRITGSDRRSDTRDTFHGEFRRRHSWQIYNFRRRSEP